MRTFSGEGGGRGAHVKFKQECSSCFRGLKFGQILFYWVGKFFGYFFGFGKNLRYFWESEKFPAIFLGLPILASHT